MDGARERIQGTSQMAIAVVQMRNRALRQSQQIWREVDGLERFKKKDTSHWSRRQADGGGIRDGAQGTEQSLSQETLQEVGNLQEMKRDCLPLSIPLGVILLDPCGASFNTPLPRVALLIHSYLRAEEVLLRAFSMWNLTCTGSCPSYFSYSASLG